MSASKPILAIVSSLIILVTISTASKANHRWNLLEGYDLLKSSSGGNYGYGFVNGYWDDGTSFYIHLLSPETYSNINLIPEPASLLLLAFGVLLLRSS